MKDYHDLCIANLERIAEEQYIKADTAVQAGEVGALECFQQWSKILSGIGQIKNMDAKTKTPQMGAPSKKASLGF